MGNLSFDVTREELIELFTDDGQAGLGVELDEEKMEKWKFQRNQEL